jgi:hypothetical protein
MLCSKWRSGKAVVGELTAAAAAIITITARN